MLKQIESGVYCPLAMTYGSVPTLAARPGDRRGMAADDFRARLRPRASVRCAKRPAALIGMGMTENQGGSDLRTNTTRAEPAGDGYFRLHWPQMVPVGADVRRLPGAGAIAQRPELLLHAALDAGRRAQRIHILRLKDKLGNSSNASSEVEFDGAYAQLVGEEGPRHSDHHRDGATTRGSIAASARPP